MVKVTAEGNETYVMHFGTFIIRKLQFSTFQIYQ